MRFRFFLISFFFFILFGLIEAKLYHLQILKRDYYFNKVEALNELQKELALKRGKIFFTDRHNNEIPVAINKKYQVVYAVPKEIEDPEATAATLAPIIGLKEAEIKKSLDNPKSLFYPLVEKASPEIVNAVTSLNLKGIYVISRDHRYYEFGSLAANVLGFVGLNNRYKVPTGLYGLEKFRNDFLSDDKNLSLTIDRNIQTQSEIILKNLSDKFNIKSGTIIVMNPKTGAILSLANLPSFDPNSYSDFDVSSFVNLAVQGIYEPGSVFKPLTMAAGIDLGVITPDTKFTDTGGVTLNGKTITNWDHKAHGLVTMTNVIEQSINTGAVFAAQKVGLPHFLDYLKKFGFGEITEIDLPDEVDGSLRNLEKKKVEDIDFATASFGQGTAVTPIQMIRAFASLANGGLLIRPYLESSSTPKIIRRVISEETAKKVTAMMESAVTKARLAAVENYRIAGKTGTAQIPDLKYGGYLEEYNHTFIGFGPVSDPKFIALIKIERPSAELAGQTVVPAFKELAQYILSYYNVPPDKIVSE